jgi:hypothetical protein
MARRADTYISRRELSDQPLDFLGDLKKRQTQKKDLAKRSSQPLTGAITSSQPPYEVRPRKDKRGVTLIPDALPFGRLSYGEANVLPERICHTG